MSSVSGSSGQNPNPIPPKDPNAHLDNVDNKDNSSQDQGGASGGVTETGLSVEVLSAGEVTNVDPVVTGIQDVANSSIGVGMPLTSCSSPLSTEAAGLTEEMVSDLYEIDDDFFSNFNSDSDMLFDGVEESKVLIDGLKKKIGEFQKTKLGAAGQSSKKSNEEGTDLEEQFLDLRRSLASLNGCVNSLESRAGRLVSALGDTHHEIMDLSIEDLRGAFGDRSEEIISTLEHFGLRLGEGGWKIDSKGAIPKISQEVQDVRLLLEGIHFPTEEEFIRLATESTEEASCCQALINKLKTLWNTLIQMFHTLYDKMLLFLFWIAKKIRSKLQFPSVDKSKKDPRFENPFASTLGTISEHHNAASVRTSVSGRGDLSDEDAIRRPEESTIETQDVDNQDSEGQRGDKDDS
ncbi:hypothetical protein C834K_0264 [Chlamydia poikilotherma]|uniref:Uncharacterized protein n=1 Tax=Chlamydia poikilotherma TaxID=1967783 RepID=A0A3B0PV15_9CHLA|nr:hypothetical protein [Chlamydia poikilotherma]SYX08736.1 hypothetical protein C834K_0264 [Chlamydia poikilotherma]